MGDENASKNYLIDQGLVASLPVVSWWFVFSEVSFRTRNLLYYKTLEKQLSKGDDKNLRVFSPGLRNHLVMTVQQQ